MSDCTIARLFIYPIKSCAGIEVQQARLLQTGLEWDRAWMLVDTHGEFVTQRELPRMALIQPWITADALVLQAPGMSHLSLPLMQADGIRKVRERVRVWDDTVNAFDEGDPTAQWLSSFLGESVRLVRFDPAVQRYSSAKWTNGVLAPNQFSDGFPVLLTCEASVAELNARLNRAGHASVGVERFRANVVLAGLDAHDEDWLDTLYIHTNTAKANAQDAVQLKPVKPCARCPIPNIDPATAQSDPRVGDTLQTYRKNARMNGAITFGMNAIVLAGSGQTLQVGQRVSADINFGD